MTATTNTTILTTDGWTSVAVDPSAISIAPTHSGKGTWHLAIAASPPAADFLGEVYHSPDPWNGSSITGTIYIRVDNDMTFGVTQ